MSKIKNVVFDIGNVLIAYTPVRVLESFTELGDADHKILFEHIFGSRIWLDLDRGDFGLEEAADMISKEIPKYESYVRRVFKEECLELMFSEMPGTPGFLEELKKRGYKIYLLSNFSREGFEYVDNRFKYLSEADGRIISSHVGFIKPMREIYELLLDRFELKPDETLFIDDMPENCAGAESIGIKTICFCGYEALEREFEKLISIGGVL